MRAPETTLLDLLRERAELDATAPAIVDTDGSVRLTYGQLLAATTDLAAQLIAIGAGPDRVTMLSMPNGPEALVATLAAMIAGTCAPMNPAYTLAELAAMADDIDPTIIVVAGAAAGAPVTMAETRGHTLLRCPPLDAGRSDTPSDVRCPAPSDVALLLHTSGTTARPKQVPLTHANLASAARNVAASLQLDARDRCLNVMPLFHSHGLLGAALGSLAGGSSIVCTTGMDPRRFLTWARATGSTWYSAAPTIHHLVTESPGEWAGFRFMRSASGPIAPQLARALEQRFDAPLIEVYGMTEAYQICANPLPPGERRLGTVGIPTGTDVAVFDDGGRSVDTGLEGEIVVRGPAVFAGYSKPPGANERAFFDDWFRTGDLGRLSEDGYLTITGRVKEQINRGGEKIAPREVEEVLLDHPLVVEAMAFGFPHEKLGQDVGVALVAAPGTTVDVVALRSFMAERVAAFKVPRRILVVDELPKSSTGKLQRIAFVEQHAAELTKPLASREADAPASDVSARESTIDVLARIWRDVLELDELPDDGANFFDLGGSSLAAMELIVRIEDDLGVDLPVIDVLDVPALGDLAERVDALAAGADASPLLRQYRSGSESCALVLVPGQFGMAIGLNLIADAIDADRAIYMFDYPGHRSGQQPRRTVEELAGALVAELQRAGIAGDVAMYGNSLGGWVAFEAARELARLGTPARLVAIGDMYSPIFQGPESPVRPPLSVRLQNRVRRLRREVASLRSRRPSNDMPIAVARQQAVVRASEHARRQYRAHPYDGDVFVVTASQRTPKFGATLGWDRHVTGTVRTFAVDANHGDMHHVQADAIGHALSHALRSSHT